MDDQRREQRTHLIYYLRVFETGTDSLFGHVVDISKHGMLISSSQPLQANRIYHLAIEDISTLDTTSTIEVDLECRWCQSDPDYEVYDAGFRLVAPSGKVRDMVASCH